MKPHVGHTRIAVLAGFALLLLSAVLELLSAAPGLPAVLQFLFSALFLAAVGWVLARAVLLRHRWARVVGFLVSLWMLLALPAYWKLAGVAFLLLFAFGWRYRDAAAEEAARAMAWAAVPVPARLGAVHLLHGVLAVVCLKAAPALGELYAAQGVGAAAGFTGYFLVPGGFALLVSAVTLVAWALCPGRNAQYAKPLQALFWLGLVLLVLSCVALYAPVFLPAGSAAAP